MKKFNLSLVTVLAMGTFAFAGGDIAPVEPMIETPMVEESTPGNFYLGLAYGLLNVTGEDKYDTITETFLDDDFNEVMIQAGYKFNPYIALEGRYWFGLDESIDNPFIVNTDVSVDAWGIYAKPMYPVTSAFNVYALLGYGGADLTSNVFDSESVDGFSWGLGADYSFTDNVSVFVDYVSIYDDSEDFGAGLTTDYTIDTWNFGVAYKF